MEINQQGLNYLIAHRLTTRQLEAVTTMVKTYPCTSKELADKLCITDKGVKSLLTEVYKSLGVTNKYDLLIKLIPYMNRVPIE